MLTVDSVIDATRDQLLNSGTLVAVYVTEAVALDLKERFKTQRAPYPVVPGMPTMFGTPVIVNAEMASVGGRGWEPVWRTFPA